MAEKEATVYIIDVGASMGVKHAGRPETDLDWSMRYVWDRITSAVSTNRKTLKIGVVGLRTKETANDLSQEDESYDHVSVLHPISQLLMPDLHELREKIRPSRTEAGDAISALVIAIKMIGDHCQKQQYRRKIVLTTNGLGTMDDDGVDEIARKLVEDRIELVVLGVDFDDPEFGVKEEDKDPRKAANEQLLKDLVEKSKGVYGTMAQAIAELSIPRVKRVTPVPGFRGRLTLGDPQSEDGIIRIDVWRYPRTMVARAPSASAFVQRRANEDGAQTQSTATMASSDKDVDLALVRYNRIYQVSDDGAIGGKRDVGRDELAKGYEYGRTAVHISPSDENVTKLETHASLEVMGFVTQAAVG
ncbi:MAG: hypothetical protein M1823_005813 [Watsoniomyces obsoletus]|nr:MAG: hypothetical protein M1823_005813 [Watsoniomyces obsoletus]